MPAAAPAAVVPFTDSMHRAFRLLIVLGLHTAIPGLLADPARDFTEPMLEFLSARAKAGESGAAERLTSLVNDLSAGNNPRDSLRGLHEWAYRSRVDDSVQPFTVVVPDEDRTAGSWGLIIEPHWGGGTHVRKGVSPLPGILQVYVLGHSASSRNRGLSEVDFIEVTDFVSTHWPIDRRRVGITGGSLGGAGSFTLASRHPDWFAAVRPVAGWASGSYPENLFNTRLLAITSRDDTAIHLLARAGIEAITRQGGRATHWMVNGVGHGSPAPLTGSAHDAWLRDLRPLRAPAKFRYTAEDEAATGAWGVDVAIWGDEARPAAFAFSRDASSVRLTTDNVHRLRLRAAAWEHPADTPLVLTVNDTPLPPIPAPLPAELFVERTENTWKLITPSPAEGRAHFPGGFDALLHGQRVAMIYGTQGSPDAVARRRDLATYVASLPIAATRNKPERLHGRLPVLADTDNLSAILDTHDLVLIGDATENTLAARLAASFPAKLSPETVSLPTGETWPLADATLGLLGRNAQHPQRLLYWIVSRGDAAYTRDALPFKLHGFDTRPSISPDLLLVANTEDRLVAARRLTGRWQWATPVAPATPLTAEQTYPEALAQLAAEAFRRAAQTDAGLALSREPEAGFRVYPSATPALTTIEDYASLRDGLRLLIIEPTGAELRRVLSAPKLGVALAGLSPDAIDDRRRYRVACIGADAWAPLRVIKNPELPLEATELDAGHVLRRHATPPIP